MMSRIRNWATAFLAIPRWLLTVKYGLFTVYGILASIAGAPTLANSVGESYAFVWSIGLALTAAIACVASIWDGPRGEQIEKWAAIAVVALLSAFLVGAVDLAVAGDTNRVSFSVLVLIVTLLPAARAAALIVTTTPRDHFNSRGVK